MRDLVAGVVAIALLVLAGSLATTLTLYRRRRQRTLDSERALGRTIIAELPTSEDLTLFSEDRSRFYYGGRSIDKDLIVAVRVLINGAPIAAAVSPRRANRPATAASVERAAPAPALRDRDRAPGVAEDQAEGIARDRWDVAIETLEGTVLVECGAIRERVSQELARAVFDAVRREVEQG